MLQIELNRVNARISFEDNEIIVLQDELILEKHNGKIFASEDFAWLVDQYNCLTLVKAEIYGDALICAVVSCYVGTFKAKLISGNYFIYHTVSNVTKLVTKATNEEKINERLSDYCTNFLEISTPYLINLNNFLIKG